jgi:hypothetical protein
MLMKHLRTDSVYIFHFIFFIFSIASKEITFLKIFIKLTVIESAVEPFYITFCLSRNILSQYVQAGRITNHCLLIVCFLPDVLDTKL